MIRANSGNGTEPTRPTPARSMGARSAMRQPPGRAAFCFREDQDPAKGEPKRHEDRRPCRSGPVSGTNSRTRSTPRRISTLPIEFRSSGRGFTRSAREKSVHCGRTPDGPSLRSSVGIGGEGVSGVTSVPSDPAFPESPPNRTCGGYAGIDQNDPERKLGAGGDPYYLLTNQSLWYLRETSPGRKNPKRVVTSSSATFAGRDATWCRL
jgi:hypothetical protein